MYEYVCVTHVCEIHEILTSIRCTHILPSNHVLAYFFFFGKSLHQFNQFDFRFSMKFKIVSFQLKQKFATQKTLNGCTWSNSIAPRKWVSMHNFMLVFFCQNKIYLNRNVTLSVIIYSTAISQIYEQ